MTCILFVAALSAYDLRLYEDDQVNRMHEAMQLFDEICNSKWFEKTPLVLFLNKRDLFEEKVSKVDLKVCFKEYSGGLKFQPALDFIRDRFESFNRSSRKIYTHVCTAVDKDNVKVIFNSVREVVLEGIVGDTGIGGL